MINNDLNGGTIKKNKRISVIILSFNSSKYIYQCIDSVLLQEYPLIELIISDDCSTDYNPGRIEKYIQDHQRGNIINLVLSTNSVNLGIVKNFNKAIKLSSGEFVKGLAADDKLIDQNAISEYVEFFNENIDCDIVFGDSIAKYPDGKTVLYKNSQHTSCLNSTVDFYSRLCVGNFLVAGSCCFRRVFFDKYGLFDERYNLLDDWPMWLKASRLGCKFGFITQTLFEYRANIGCSSESAKNTRYELDVENCYKYSILPFLDQIDQNRRMTVLDCYYGTYIHPKGTLCELMFLTENPKYCIFKFKRKLSNLFNSLKG